MFLWNLEKMLEIFEKVYVSTEDEEIADLARRAKAWVIERPVHLCGETPDISVYRHALSYIRPVYGFVAVHADTPLVSRNLIATVRGMILLGHQEVCTVHPFDYHLEYKRQAARVYGSVRGMSLKRLQEYEDPYRPRPEVLLVDSSPEIETREDYDRVRCSMSL